MPGNAVGDLPTLAASMQHLLLEILVPVARLQTPAIAYVGGGDAALVGAGHGVVAQDVLADMLGGKISPQRHRLELAVEADGFLLAQRSAPDRGVVRSGFRFFLPEHRVP